MTADKWADHFPPEFQKARIAELERSLKNIRSLAAFEQAQPTGMHMTCLSLIEKDATLALAGCDTYDMELKAEPTPPWNALP